MSPKKYITPEEALLKLADSCAAAEKCEFECRRKLRQWHISGTDADRIIDYLDEHSFLDAARYARAYVADKARFNKWGKRRLRSELAMRKIPSDIIREALDALDEEEYAAYAHTAAQAALRGVDLQTLKGRQTFVRRMASRGYEWPLIERQLSARGADTSDISEYDEGLD